MIVRFLYNIDLVRKYFIRSNCVFTRLLVMMVTVPRKKR